MSQERDTHFQNFAKMLWNELEPPFRQRTFALDEGNVSQGVELTQLTQTLIAQRAYDLVAHVFNRQGEVQWERLTTATEAAAYIPDMDKWPE